MGEVKQAIFTFSKAQCSSMLSSILDFLITIILVEVFGVWYVIGTFIGSVCGGIANCIVNFSWVFHTKGQRKRNVAIKYLAVWLVSIALNTGGTTLFTELLPVPYIVVKAVVAVCVGFFWNYQMHRLYVFKTKQ